MEVKTKVRLTFRGNSSRIGKTIVKRMRSPRMKTGSEGCQMELNTETNKQQAPLGKGSLALWEEKENENAHTRNVQTPMDCANSTNASCPTD